MAVSFQGVGTWALSTTSGATITYAFPGGYTKTVGDLMILVSGGWTGTTTAPATRPTGFTLRGTSLRTPVAGSSIIIFYEWKLVASTGEATPTRTVPTDGNWSSSNNTFNLGGYMLVFRGVDQSSPFDQTSDTTGNSAAASTLQGPSITAATTTTMVVQSAITGDNNQLTLGTANGFTARASGASYSSAVTGLEAFGSATQAYTTTGAKTACTWSQAVNGPDSWATIATIIRGATVPGTPTGITTTAATATSSSIDVSWTAPSTGNAAGGITSYTVQYSSNGGTSWTTFSSAITGTSTTVTGLSPFTAYLFRVSATNVIGTGAYGTITTDSYTDTDGQIVWGAKLA